MSYQAQREQALSQVIQAIRSSLDLQTVFETAVQEIGTLLQVDHVKISQYLPNQKVWLTVAHYRSRPDLHLSVGECIPDENNPVTVLLKRLEFFRIDDTNLCEDEVSREIAKTFPGAWLILPLQFNSSVWGSLCLLIDGHPHFWRSDEVELASLVADQLAIAIQQSQLYQQTLYQAQREKALNRVIQTIRGSLDLQTVFDTAVKEISKLLPVDRVEIVQYLPQRKLWLTVADCRQRADLPASLGLEIPDEGNPVALRLKQLEIIRIDDTNNFSDEINKHLAQAFSGAWLLVPVHFHSSVWGSLTLSIDGRAHSWQDSEVELACAVVDQMAIAIEQSQLYQQVQQLAEAEIMKALQRERELSEAKSNFITMTSHEFRTPLTTIQSSTEFLKCYRERLSQQKQLTHLDRIQTAVTQMTRMLDDVLTFSEAEAGQLQFNPKPTDLVQLCHSLVIELQMSDNHQHKISFKATGDRIEQLLLLDEKLLRYVLTNLFSNAFKYSPKTSNIHFEVTCFDENVVFKIQDQGIGIPASDISYLFEAFYRATNTGTIKGTGLGLAIAKQCIELHGGIITVDSVVNEGTTFTVMLPLSK